MYRSRSGGEKGRKRNERESTRFASRLFNTCWGWMKMFIKRRSSTRNRWYVWNGEWVRGSFRSYHFLPSSPLFFSPSSLCPPFLHPLFRRWHVPWNFPERDAGPHSCRFFLAIDFFISVSSTPFYSSGIFFLSFFLFLLLFLKPERFGKRRRVSFRKIVHFNVYCFVKNFVEIN